MTEKKIAIYARAEGPRAEASITAQIDSCRRFAASRGCAEPSLFIEQRDRADVGRTAFDRLWITSAVERYDMVLATTRDRLDRDPTKLRGRLEWLARFGLVVHFVLEDGGFVTDPI